MAFVKNNTAHMIGIGLPAKRTADQKSLGVESVRLMPGMNTVPDAQWKAIANHAAVKLAIKAGDLEESSSGSGGGDLGDLTVPDAAAKIAETYDQALLKQWQKADERKGVQDAIEKQFEKIANDGKDQ